MYVRRRCFATAHSFHLCPKPLPPAPRVLYPKTSKARPQTPNVKLQYVLPNSTFEFGPLLAGRQLAAVTAEGAPPEGHPDHTGRFKIANCGLFALHADFWLKSEGEAADPAFADAARAGAKKGMAAAPPAS